MRGSRLSLYLTAFVLVLSACGSSANAAKWCATADSRFFDRERESPDDELEAWVDAAPSAIRDDTSTYVEIITIYLDRIANAEPADVQQVTAKAFDDLSTNQVFAAAATEIQNYAMDNCPGLGN